jgi:hypothetical protein
MTKLRSGRPSPAMVLAALALVFAMVGTAVAGPDGVSNKITKSKVKKIAKKQAKKQLKANVDGSHVNLADKATDADHATTANTAAPTGAAGGALNGSYPDPGFAKEVVPLTLTAGWAPETGTTPVPAVWKDAYNVVHFRGALERTSGASSQPFTLPSQFRPTTTKFPGLTIQGGFGFLTIQPDGTVTASTLTAGSSIAGFLGIEDVEFEAGT